MNASTVILNASALQMRAALAEAWHVDSCFSEAVAEWEALVGERYNSAESTLKAAISCFSSNQYQKGLYWLHVAESSGASREETLYVLAQYYWQCGQIDSAISAFQQAEQSMPHLGKASNALGVLYWKLGWTREARQQFERALEQDPDDGDALVNMASLHLREESAETSTDVAITGRAEVIRELLARAAYLLPHRFEPFVWSSRLLRYMNVCADKEVHEALNKARLRGHFLGSIPHARQSMYTGTGDVQVHGQLSIEHIQLNCTYFYAHLPKLPEYLAVNTGYQRVEIGGVAVSPVCDEDVRKRFELPFTTNVTFYRIPPNAWRRSEAGVLLDVSPSGVPTPPCVTLSNEEIEFDGRGAAWLPLPVPLTPLRWQIDMQLSHSYKVFLSSNEPEEDGVGLIALHTPTIVSLTTQDERTKRITGIARNDSPVLRLACLLVQRTMPLWEERVGSLRSPHPDVIMVNQPGSLFCYARRNYIRLPSGIGRKLELLAQVCHETGHLWWGLDVRFIRSDEWLGEALAEYTLHLAQDAGWLPGYRQDALTRLHSMQNGTLPTEGIEKLQKRTEKHAAYILRVKGGFVIAMLRIIMGEVPFWNLLRTVHALGHEQYFDAYHFFALASRFHGSSLNWFVNQWIYADASMAFSVEAIRLIQDGSTFYLTFTVRCPGIAIPGKLVKVVIYVEGGKEHYVSVNLNLATAIVTVSLPMRPKSITIDPDALWYAERANAVISGE